MTTIGNSALLARQRVEWEYYVWYVGVLQAIFFDLIATAAEEEVGPGREGSMSPACGRQNEGGEGAQRRCLRRGIDVGGRRANPPPQDGGLRRHRRRRRPLLVVTAASAIVSGAPASC